MRNTILTFAILLLTTTTVLAQKQQTCHNDGPLAGNCGQTFSPLSEVGPTTSPIQPRKSNDTRFIENQDAIRANGDEIDQQLPAIVESFGVDSIHLVAHSKGGLDSRSYLQIHQPTHDNQFRVLSLNTLGSPHDGTLLTDLLQARKDARDAVGRTGSINYENFPNWVDKMVGLVGFDKGLQALTTKNVAAFNAENVSALPPSLSITAVGSDADKSENGHINRQPDEYAGMRKFSFALNLTEVAPSLGEFAMDTVYQILRNTSRIKLECCREEKILFVRRKIATIRAVPSDIVIPNDILVPAASAIGAESIEPRSFRNLIYLAADGRDHGLIADARVAAQTVVWILFIEQTRGDLR